MKVIQVAEYYSVVKKGGGCSYMIQGVSLENVKWQKQDPKDHMVKGFCLCGVSKIEKSVDTESRFFVARAGRKE